MEEEVIDFPFERIQFDAEYLVCNSQWRKQFSKFQNLRYKFPPDS
jgi:hypothetical protein